MKKGEARSRIRPEREQESEGRIKRDKFGNHPSPPFKLSTVTLPVPLQIRFRLKEGYFEKEGLFFSNFPSIIVIILSSTEIPPLDE
jgi:hypothetical protein